MSKEATTLKMKQEFRNCCNQIAEMMRKSEPLECLEFIVNVNMNAIDLDSIQNEDELAARLLMYADNLVGCAEDAH